MTEQEAEALTDQLTRIWNIKGVVPEIEFGGCYFRFKLRWEDVKFIHYDELDGCLRSFMLLSIIPSVVYGNQATLHFRADTKHNSIGMNVYGERYDQFAAEWLPFFRRGCWLSGCPIEASAHEKAEWMQGFSREEIDTWNLKM